jgi:hypothetical protein
MASLLSQLAILLVGTPKPAATPVAKGPVAKPQVANTQVAKPKSAERLANEQSILANRRKILANMAAMQKERESKHDIAGISDKDTLSAAEFARKILLDQGSR